MRDVTPSRDGDVMLGDDFVAPRNTVESELQAKRARRGLFSLNRSPLTRKIVTFNLIALNVLAAGILFLNSSRDTMAYQRANMLISEAHLLANLFEAALPRAAPVNFATEDGIDVADRLQALDLREGLDVIVYDPAGRSIGQASGAGVPLRVPGVTERRSGGTPIVDSLSAIWTAASRVFPAGTPTESSTVEAKLAALVPDALSGTARVLSGRTEEGTFFAVAAPIRHNNVVVGVLGVANTSPEIDRTIRQERERVLRMFVIATLVSIGLSLVLASTIANPISELAEAAELGRDRDRGKAGSGRIRIPDLTARPDEIGRLSGALRGMVSALYDRIDSNEQFAADVAHEIKNPLASLRSAVGSMRMVKKDEHRIKLMDVIEHDVRRLDRLVSEISNASRLDSELVKEEEEAFDLMRMIANLSEYLGEQAGHKGVDFITDLPPHPIVIQGLEARLAQVFVNLITNAISFCEDGDAIRVWARQRENRVLVVVEDTGPGIPDEALTKVFKRFYSERPEGQFGNNSGLGLAISKQIVEAHGGVIWAENIRPTDADITSDPLGARFVVGLPV